jgi:hypothetical protein
MHALASYRRTGGSLGGKASGVVRRDASEGMRADARIMAAAGMSVRAIAKSLEG